MPRVCGFDDRQERAILQLLLKINVYLVVSWQKHSATTWQPSDLRGFICISGPCNMIVTREILHQHGLDRTIVSAMFCGDVEAYSPTHKVLSLNAKQKELLETSVPPIAIMHGKADKTVSIRRSALS